MYFNGRKISLSLEGSPYVKLASRGQLGEYLGGTPWYTRLTEVLSETDQATPQHHGERVLAIDFLPPKKAPTAETGDKYGVNLFLRMPNPCILSDIFIRQAATSWPGRENTRERRTEVDLTSLVSN